ncbi:MAG: hypothetical protein IJ906_16615 [Oscillospiraceae bacterium]|nr:hypothetical protein [Oscillospiraceae bacterium]
MTVKAARGILVRMIMQPWFGGEQLPTELIESAVRVLNLSRSDRRTLHTIIENYELQGGKLQWRKEQLPALGRLVRAILNISDKELEKISQPEELMRLVLDRLKRLTKENLQNICFVITAVTTEKQYSDCIERKIEANAPKSGRSLHLS